MKDEDKTKEQLLNELVKMRQNRLLAIVRDISERKLIEEELIKYHNHLDKESNDHRTWVSANAWE